MCCQSQQLCAPRMHSNSSSKGYIKIDSSNFKPLKCRPLMRWSLLLCAFFVSNSTRHRTKEGCSRDRALATWGRRRQGKKARALDLGLFFGLLPCLVLPFLLFSLFLCVFFALGYGSFLFVGVPRPISYFLLFTRPWGTLLVLKDMEECFDVMLRVEMVVVALLQRLVECSKPTIPSFFSES